MVRMIKHLDNKLKKSRNKLELAFKNIVEKEKLSNYYKYYANYYWIKSSDIQVEIWLCELDELLSQELLVKNRGEELYNKIKQIENHLVHIMANLKKCDEEAIEKGWKLGFSYPTIHEYIKNVYKNTSKLRKKIKELKINS